jgi:hypothetical protein
MGTSTTTGINVSDDIYGDNTNGNVIGGNDINGNTIGGNKFNGSVIGGEWRRY